MSVLVKNGEIMTADERYVADLFCEDETITRIGRDLPAPNDADVIDATGSMFSPASSTRMCTFTSLSWARSRRTRTSREPRRARRRDDDVHRNDLPGLRGKAARGFRV